MARKVRVETLSDVTARVGALKVRFARQHKTWRDLDPWRHYLVDQLEDQIRGPKTPQSAWFKTIAKPDIASVTTTVVSFLSGRDPVIMVQPKSPDSLMHANAADLFERLGAAIWHQLDKDREDTLLSEITEHIVHRGACVVKVLWLSPEERGEVREEVPLEGVDPVLSLDGDNLVEDVLTEERVVEPGTFPILVQVIDPLECVWVRGKDGRTTEFAHVCQSTWDEICDNFPDIEDHPDFKGQITLQSLDSSVEVIDYWDETVNATIVNGTLYKLAEHGYPCIPVVVELAKPRQVPVAPGAKTRYQREGTPFCLPMLEPIRNLSWSESVVASYLNETVYATLKHRRIKSDGSSPYFVVATDGPDKGKKIYRNLVEIGPGQQVMPLFDDEDLEYVQPPPIVQVAAHFQDKMARDAQVNSFHEGILTGMAPAGPSGVSVIQQRVATIARMEPYRMGGDRTVTRTLQMVVKVALYNWDYGDAKLVLDDLIGLDENDPEGGITKELLEAIGPIQARVQAEVPTNEEQERAFFMQALSQNTVSRKTVINKLNIAQDADREMERIAFEMLAFSDEQFLRALAMEHAYKSGLMERPAGAPAQPPVPQSLNAPPLPSSPTQPVPGQPLPPTNGAAGPVPVGGEMPPEAAMMMQMLAQGGQ